MPLRPPASQPSSPPITTASANKTSLISPTPASTTPTDAEPLLDALSQRRKFLLKLYGVLEKPESLIFAPIEYREAISRNISFGKFMEGCFYSRTFLFVGLSLEGISDFLAGFVFRGANPRKHYALVAVQGAAWKAKAQLLERRYNVKVLDFPVSAGFPEVNEFLRKLKEEAPAPTTPTAHATTTQTNPGIHRLTLEDIGPFEKLELDFSQANGKSSSAITELASPQSSKRSP
ncbi:MAG: SIR2 family protein [Anaeromyxobacter sp.]